MYARTRLRAACSARGENAREPPAEASAGANWHAIGMPAASAASALGSPAFAVPGFHWPLGFCQWCATAGSRGGVYVEWRILFIVAIEDVFLCFFKNFEN